MSEQAVIAQVEQDEQEKPKRGRRRKAEEVAEEVAAEVAVEVAQEKPKRGRRRKAEEVAAEAVEQPAQESRSIKAHFDGEGWAAVKMSPLDILRTEVARATASELYGLRDACHTAEMTWDRNPNVAVTALAGVCPLSPVALKAAKGLLSARVFPWLLHINTEITERSRTSK